MRTNLRCFLLVAANQPGITITADSFLLVQDICRVNRLPSSFKQLLHTLFHRCKGISSADILVALIYYLSFESGFVPNTFPPDESVATYWGYKFVAQIPAISAALAATQIHEQYSQFGQLSSTSSTPPRQSEQIYKFSVKLLSFADEEVQLIIRKVFNGDAVCVTFCSVGEEQQAKSVCLLVNEFLEPANILQFDQIQENPQHFFRNIDKLIELIVVNVIAPIRTQLMANNRNPNAALIGLPKEILWVLLRHFRNDLKSLQALSQTCSYLRQAAIAYLEENAIRLRNRRPTPIIRDPHFRPFNFRMPLNRFDNHFRYF